MSSLTSASTFAQIQAAYADNASYQEDGSVAKARAFMTACRLLLMQMPSKAAHGKGGSIEINTALIRDELRGAQAWLATAPQAAVGGGVTFPRFDGLRGLP